MYEKTARLQYNSIPLVTALPASADNGDEVVLTNSLSAGTYFWHLRYVAARASNKWIFVGGAPFYHAVETDEGTATSGSYVDLATVGPTFTTPVAGLWDVTAQCHWYPLGAASGWFSLNEAGVIVLDSLLTIGTSGWHAMHRLQHRSTATVAASSVIKIQYKRDSVAQGWSARRMHVQPVALGG